MGGAGVLATPLAVAKIKVLEIARYLESNRTTKA
jgi:hypothetical protein